MQGQNILIPLQKQKKSEKDHLVQVVKKIISVYKH